MRIGLDGRMMTLRLAGIGRYAIQNYQWLSRLERGPELEVYPSRQAEVGPRKGSGKSILSENRLYRSICGLPGWARRKKIDLYHATNYGSAPLGAMPVPWVLTVHDLLPLENSEYHDIFFSARTRFLMRHNIPRADHILAVSARAYQSAKEILKIDPGKMTLVPLAIDEELWWPPREDDSQVRASYGLDWPYLLCVGTLNPRKNFLGVLRAFKRVLSEKKDDNHRVVLAGNLGWKSETILDYLRQNNLGDKVRILGHVPGHDLPAIYRGATALVHPSFYESFAYPVLEAYGARVPTITSRIPLLPESVGDCSLLVDPLAEDELAHALAEVINNPGLREKLIKGGQERCAKFSWKETAARTVAAYQKVMEGNN